MEPTCGSLGTLELKMEKSEMGESARLSFLLPSRAVIAQPVETNVMEINKLRKTLAMGLVAITVFSATAQADEDQESSVVTVGKSTFYGALTGLLVGGATALVAGGNSGDILKWSFVAGTSVGLIWGVHDVSTRPEQNTAMFSLKSDGSTTVSLPTPQLRYSGNGDLGFDMTVFSLAF